MHEAGNLLSYFFKIFKWGLIIFNLEYSDHCFDVYCFIHNVLADQERLHDKKDPKKAEDASIKTLWI